MSAGVSPLTSMARNTQAAPARELAQRDTGNGSFSLSAFEVGTAKLDPRGHAPGASNPTICK